MRAIRRLCLVVSVAWILLVMGSLAQKDQLSESAIWFALIPPLLLFFSLRVGRFIFRGR